jgi:hypothetical protein
MKKRKHNLRENSKERRGKENQLDLKILFKKV